MSSQSELSSKEQQLISVIESGAQNQRNIAESTGFSLGMTNVLLKRLVQKGYIKVVQLNGRTLRYILTPRGFKEKLDRSFNYFVNSIRYLNEVRERILAQLDQCRGIDNVYVLGSNELSEIVIDVLRNQQLKYNEIDSSDLNQSMLGENVLVFVCDISEEPVDLLLESDARVLHPEAFF